MVPGLFSSLSIDVCLCLKHEKDARILSPYVAHHDVDKGVLDEGEENKESARRHEHINCLPENGLQHTKKYDQTDHERHLEYIVIWVIK